MSKRARNMTLVRAPPTKAEETLRKYAAAAAIKLDHVGDWTSFVAGERGRPDIALTAETLPHKAARLMKHLRRRGASVPMRTAPWDLDRVLRAASRGSHSRQRMRLRLYAKNFSSSAIKDFGRSSLSQRHFSCRTCNSRHSASSHNATADPG